MNVSFSDFFEVHPKTVEKYGAFDISLVADLPLFVDPFLLFNSKNKNYQDLHEEIIRYLSFLRNKSAESGIEPGILKAWYTFPEIEQNWLGFSVSGNRGRGLGPAFATALHENLGKLFTTFGKEKVTKGSHLEKLCLIREGVGRDNISDFTNNLIFGFLLTYTQGFARKYVDKKLCRPFTLQKVRFNYQTESWEADTFDLPCFRGEFVILTPKDILTRDETWINKTDLVDQFRSIPDSIPNEALRAQINNYFQKVLPKNPRRDDERKAALDTIHTFPESIDYFIKYKEDHGDQAVTISSEKVTSSHRLYLEQFKKLPDLLRHESEFYCTQGQTYPEAQQRVQFFKDVIENKGGHRLFYFKGQPIEREEDLHILYRLTWFATETEVTREANDGRGPVDFKISKGSSDKTLVEFKLAKNTQLERNLQKQAEVYEKASDARVTIKVIVFFSASERIRVERILKKLNMSLDPNVTLVDARRDNKPSGSKA
jgi:hypothetical protein